MTNISRLAIVVLCSLFWTAGIGTSSYAQPPPLPYTHYKIVNAEVQGELVVGEPVTIIVVIQDIGNVDSSSGTYEIYIDRTPVDYSSIYLGSGDRTTIRYTHYFEAPGTYSIDIVTCSELGSCPDDIASGTISIKDSSLPPVQPPPLLPPPPTQSDWPKIESFYYNSSQELEFRISNFTCLGEGGLRFTIDFGDGSPLYYRDRANCGRWMVPHKYYGTGPYIATLTVCNSDGSCKTATTTIGGTPLPPPPPPPSNRPPSVTLSCYPLNLTPNDTLSCEASASDPNGDPLTYEWFLNEQKLTNISPSSNRVYWDKPQPGFYTLKVVVSDNRGGTSQSSVSFTVQETRQNKLPVIQSIEYDPSNPVAGRPVRFWASVYDENGWIVAYEWDFGSLPFQAEEQAEYAWQNPGTYRVCLTVYDNDGASARKCRDITVQAARTLLPPQANFTFSPSSPKVGETVYFRDRSTDPDNGRIIGWVWSFGNEQFSYESNPSYTYQQPGRYTVCLAVFDNDDLSDQKCIDITVQPDDRLTKQPPIPRFTMTAPNGQTAQENQTLTLTVPRGGKVSINFSASTSYDPDGGGIRSYGWWINGTFVSQSSQFSFELEANTPRHLIRLKVTDDEGQTAEVGAEIVITEQPGTADLIHLKAPWDGGSTRYAQTYNNEYGPHGGHGFWNAVDFYTGRDGNYTGGWNVRAAHSGTARFLENWAKCTRDGKPQTYVDITNESLGIRTRYVHIIFPEGVKANDVKEVKEGDIIGIARDYNNRDGCQNAPHLHFEVHRIIDGKPNKVDMRNVRLDGQLLFPVEATGPVPVLWGNAIIAAGAISLDNQYKGLARIAEKPEIYWIQNGKRYHVLGTDRVKIDILDAMKSLPGWGWNKVQIVSAEALAQFTYAGEFVSLDNHSNGILVRQQGFDPVYVIEGGRTRHVSFEEFEGARKFDWKDVIEVSAEIMRLLGIDTSDDKSYCKQLRQIDNSSRLEKFAQAIQNHEGWFPGSRSCKNNNPGNLKFIGQTGAIGKDKDGFAIFGTYDQGWQALLNDIRAKIRNNPSWNFYDFFKVYAPSSDNNDPRAYAEEVAKRLGVTASTIVREYLNQVGGIDRGDIAPVPPPATTKTIEQAIASLVPNDPPDVAQPDAVIGDVEMTRALGYYEKQQPVPNTDGKVIDDVTMLRLQDLWLSRRPVSSSSSLVTSLRREWGLLTRSLDRRTVEFIALGFDVRSIRVEIFNLQGQRVFAEEAPNNRLTFRGQDSQGQRLANGVYLYVVTVRSHDGTIQRSSVRKLVLQR